MRLFKKKQKVTPGGMALTEAMLNLEEFDIETQNEIMKQYNDSDKKFIIRFF